MPSHPDTFTDYLVKPATCGAVAAAGSAYLYPGAQLPIGSYEIPVPVFFFLGTYAGSVIGELIHDKAMPHLPKINKLIDAPVTEGIAAGSIVATQFAVLQYGNAKAIQDLGLVQMAGVALAARAAGSYLSDHWIAPALSGMME